MFEFLTILVSVVVQINVLFRNVNKRGSGPNHLLGYQNILAPEVPSLIYLKIFNSKIFQKDELYGFMDLESNQNEAFRMSVMPCIFQTL